MKSWLRASFIRYLLYIAIIYSNKIYEITDFMNHFKDINDLNLFDGSNKNMK